MKFLSCQIKGCNNRGFVRYGERWICGECMMKIINKQKEKQEKEMEELEDGVSIGN